MLMSRVFIGAATMLLLQNVSAQMNRVLPFTTLRPTCLQVVFLTWTPELLMKSVLQKLEPNFNNLMAADYNYVEGVTVRNTELAFLLGRKRILGAVGFTLKNSKIENVGRGVYTDWGEAQDFYIADNVFTGRNDPGRLMGWIGATPIERFFGVVLALT